MIKSRKNIVKHKKPQLSITFWLKYHTQYKEQIYLFSDHPIFKNKPLALTYFNDVFWKVTIHTIVVFFCVTIFGVILCGQRCDLKSICRTTT